MSNKVGLQICYWWGTKIGDDLDSIIDFTAKVGADYIEINPSAVFHLSKQERADLKKRIQDKGLGVTVNGALMGPERNLCSPDPAVVKAGLERWREINELCVDLGAGIWSGIIQGIWNTRPDITKLEDDIKIRRKRGLAGVKEAVKISAEYDVLCCLEAVNRFEFFFLNTAADGVEFCREVDSPHCKLLLDTYHMNIEEDYTPDAIIYAQKNNMMGCLHCGESNRRVPKGGKTNIDWKAIGGAIKQSGYAGPLILEPFEFRTSKNAGSICTWQNRNDPEDLNSVAESAKQGIRFIKSIV